MNTHSKRDEQKTVGEKKRFSFKAHGVTAYHAAPAVLMAVAGLALTAVISDVPPAFNKAFASQDIIIEENVDFNVNGENTGFIPANKNLPDTGFLPLLSADILDSRESKTEETYDFTAHVTAITEDFAAEKLSEMEQKDRERELWEASGEPVASSNRNLYLDTYWYQRGPSNIPSTGAYTSCAPGQVISQMVPPASLTFDENGVPENYLYCIEGKSTAYYGGYMTATGSATRPGVVAVDPREIPYGTEMWIVSSDGRYVYGFARAEDTGGFIYWPKGATVDLYMNTYADCCVWGWRGVKIYVLPTSYK